MESFEYNLPQLFIVSLVQATIEHVCTPPVANPLNVRTPLNTTKRYSYLNCGEKLVNYNSFVSK